MRFFANLTPPRRGGVLAGTATVTTTSPRGALITPPHVSKINRYILCYILSSKLIYSHLSCDSLIFHNIITRMPPKYPNLRQVYVAIIGNCRISHSTYNHYFYINEKNNSNDNIAKYQS